MEWNRVITRPLKNDFKIARRSLLKIYSSCRSIFLNLDHPFYFFFFKIFLFVKKIHFEIKNPQVASAKLIQTLLLIRFRRKEKSINPKIFPIKGER